MSQDNEKMDVDDRPSSSEGPIRKKTRSRPRPSSQESLASNSDVTPASTRLSRSSHSHEPVALNLFPSSRLFNHIKDRTMAPEALADYWIKKYKANRTLAWANLLKLIVTASGSNIQITMDMLDDYEGTVEKIESEYGEDNDNFPIVSRIFAETYSSFIEALILKCKNSLIYDGYMLNRIVAFTIALSVIQRRGLRQSATLTSLRVMTALVKINRSIRRQLETVLRRIQGEIEKPVGERSYELQENLNTTREELTENIKVLREHMVLIYQGIFLKRTRDFFHQIRAICLDEFALWIDNDPTQLPRDLEFLKLGIYDEEKEVRIRTLKILQVICAVETFKPQLTGFLSENTDGIIFMVSDANLQISIEAVRLLTILVSNCRNFLTFERMAHVYKLIRAKHRPLAQAMAELLKVSCIGMDNEDTEQERIDFCHDLINFTQLRGYKYDVLYLVDAFFDDYDIVQDWPLITHHLLNDSDLDPLKCAWFLLVCVRRAATGKIPNGREPQKKKLTPSAKAELEKSKKRLTEHLIPLLPGMLEKYSERDDVIEPLLELPRYFKLNLYTKSRQEDKLEALLERMKIIVRTSTNRLVHQSAAETLFFFQMELHPKRQYCLTQVNIIIDFVVAEYVRDCNEFFGAQDGEIRNLEGFTKSVDKMSIFMSYLDLNEHKLWPSFWRFLEFFKSNPNPALNDCAHCYMGACYFSLIWYLADVDDNFPEEMIKIVKNRVYELIALLREFLTMDLDTSLHRKACLIICDLVIKFHKGLKNSDCRLMKKLVYEADDELVNLLNEFVQKYVFGVEPMPTDEPGNEFRCRRMVLIAFCKAIMQGDFKTRTGADIFKHYVNYYNDFGDIIKMTLVTCRDGNRTNLALTLQDTLFAGFSEILKAKGGIVRSEDLEVLLVLAQKFAVLFTGTGTVNEDCMLKLHLGGYLAIIGDGVVEGIVQRLAYFEILQVFSNKLTPMQKSKFLKFLRMKLPNADLITESKFLKDYKTSLGCTTPDTLRSRGKTTRGRKSRAAAQEEYETTTEAQKENNATNSPKKRRSNRPQPGKSPKKTGATPRTSTPVVQINTSKTTKKTRSGKILEKTAKQAKSKGDKKKTKRNKSGGQPMEVD